jgi:hypothetical protein
MDTLISWRDDHGRMTTQEKCLLRGFDPLFVTHFAFLVQFSDFLFRLVFATLLCLLHDKRIHPTFYFHRYSKRQTFKAKGKKKVKDEDDLKT